MVGSFGISSEDVAKTLEAIEKLSNDEELSSIEANAQAGMLAAVSTRWFGAGIYSDFSMDVDVDAVIDELEPYNSSATAIAAADLRVDGALAFSKKFNRFNLGLAVKGVADSRIEQNTSQTIGVSEAESAQINGTGLSTDVAFSTGLGKLVQAGVVFQDIYSSVEYEKSVKLGNGSEENSSFKDKLEPTIRAGVAVQPGLGFTFSGDVTNKGSIHLGVEKNLFWNGLSLRGGMVSNDGEQEYRAGLGLNLLWLHLDLGVGFDKDTSTPNGAMLNASLSF